MGFNFIVEHPEYQFLLNNESSQKDKFIWRKKRDENFFISNQELL